MCLPGIGNTAVLADSVEKTPRAMRKGRMRPAKL